MNSPNLRAGEAEGFCTATDSRTTGEASSSHAHPVTHLSPKLAAPVQFQHPFSPVDKPGQQNPLPFMLAALAMALITSTALSFAQGGRQAFHRVLGTCLSHTSNRSAEGFLLAVFSWFKPVEDFYGAAPDFRD